MSYATRYIIPVKAPRGGAYYRVLLKRRDYTGPTETLTGASGAIRVEHGRPGVPSLTEPLPGSRITVEILDRDGGVFAPIAQSDDSAWQIVLQRDATSAFATPADLGTWYVLPETFRDSPFSPVSATSVQGVDGFGLLRDVLFEPSGSSEAVLTSLAECLAELGLQGGIYTLMQWRPWLADELASTTDPLSALRTVSEFWTPGDGMHAMKLEALRQMVSRFLCQCFQSAGYWHVRQRHAVLGGTPTVWAYDENGVLTGQEARSLAVESEGIAIRSTPYREVLQRTKSVLCTYDFEPGLENVLWNGSFELPLDESDSEDTAPSDWTIEDANTVRKPTSFIESGASQSNRYLLVVDSEGYSGGGAAPAGSLAAYQEDLVQVPINPAFVLALSLRLKNQSNGQMETQSKIRFRIGSHYLVRHTLTAAADALKDERASVSIDGLLDPDANGSYVNGTAIIPENTRLTFSGGAQMTLSEDASVGDVVLKGRLTEDVASGETATFYSWTTADTTLEPIEAVAFDSGAWFQIDWRTFLITPEGDTVSGFPRFDIYKPVHNLDATPETGATNQAVYDDIVAQIQLDGRPLEELSWQGAVGSPAHGDEMEVEPFVIGDGPVRESLSRLRVTDGASVERDTIQGQDTGWKDGAYVAAEASTGETLDMLYARTLLLSRSEGLERLLCDLILRDGQAFHPHNILRHRQHTRLVYAAPFSLEPEKITVPVRVRAGTAIELGAESFTVLSVEEGAVDYTLALDADVTGSYEAGERVYYTVDYVPDRLEWDVASGVVRFEGTELYVSDQDYTIEQVIQET